MSKKSILFILGALLLFSFFFSSSLWAQESIPYSFYEKKGMEALKEGYYADAMAFFKEALLLNPSATDSLYFLNAIRRLQQGLVSVVDYREEAVALQREASYKIQKEKGDRMQVVLLTLFNEEENFSKPDEVRSFDWAENIPVVPSQKEEWQSEEEDLGSDFLELMAKQKAEEDIHIEEVSPATPQLLSLDKLISEFDQAITMITQQLSEYEKPRATQPVFVEEKRTYQKKEEIRPARISPATAESEEDSILEFEKPYQTAKVSSDRSSETRSSREQPASRVLDDSQVIHPPSAQDPLTQPTTTRTARMPSVASASELDVVYLSDELWATSPNFRLEIEIGKSVILEGRNIDRFLIVTPGFIKAERIDRDRLLVTAGQRGQTTLLIWEDHGRWTLSVEAIFPVERIALARQDTSHEDYRPFRFDYHYDWSSYYSDEGQGSLSRRSLIATQRMALYGESPYGHLDSSVTFTKFNDTTEATRYTVGLTNGQIGPFADFSIRGFDARTTFSPLTLSGRYFRGVLFEKKAFDKNLEYTLLYGRDKSTYGRLTPGILERKDFFISGGRVLLFPGGDHRYAFNYAHGHGDDRPNYLTDQVMSVQTFHQVGNMDFSLEVARSDDASAIRTDAKFALNPEMKLLFDFRDIDKDYSTITGTPSNQGETGGITTFFWNTESFSLNSSLDIYKNTLLVNPANAYAYNYDWNVWFRKPFEDLSSWSTSLYWSDTPGLVSPSRMLRIYNNYLKSFKFFKDNKRGSVSFGQSYQRSRYPYSPASEFDRYGFSAGIQIPVIDELYYYLNYEHSFLQETLTSERSQPKVITTGVNYNKRLTNNLSGALNVSYRKEQESGSSLSFLAGEDSASVTTGLTYRPTPDIDLYVDSTTRKIWPKSSGRENSLEVDVRFGARLSWEVPFSWNPQGYIGGVVFKDANADGVQNPGEEGMAGVRLTVGKEKAVTDEDGRFLVKVAAKQVQVAIDFDSVPQGHIFTTSPYYQVKIVPHQISKVDFGLTTRSGIFGVVYWDQNKNGKPDQGDIFISNVRIILNNDKEVLTDSDGSYSFANIAPGSHKITIDVNSLPLEYLPLIKLENEIDVQEGTTYLLHIPVQKK